MESLIPLALTMILSLAPRPVPNDPARTAEAFRARAAQIAADIAFVVELGPLPFDGAAAREATVAVLTAIAYHEGAHFNPAVEKCAITADNGETVSLFGLMRGASWRGFTRRDLCHGGPLPAFASLRAFEGHARRCRASAPIAYFRGYAAGSCGVKSDAATRLCKIWEGLAARAGLEGASCWRRQPITRKVTKPVETMLVVAGAS